CGVAVLRLCGQKMVLLCWGQIEIPLLLQRWMISRSEMLFDLFRDLNIEILFIISEHHCAFASMLAGLLAKSPFAR
ncbi:MAG: hypothetical protein ACE5I8_12620, partial [Thermodesulfobacteriota bacterium]